MHGVSVTCTRAFFHLIQIHWLEGNTVANGVPLANLIRLKWKKSLHFVIKK